MDAGGRMTTTSFGGRMRKSEFIEWLEAIPGEPIIMTWCPEEDEWMPVTGATYDEQELKLYTDVDEDEDEECVAS
jgi:hypothetical protein